MLSCYRTSEAGHQRPPFPKINITANVAYFWSKIAPSALEGHVLPTRIISRIMPVAVLGVSLTLTACSPSEPPAAAKTPASVSVASAAVPASSSAPTANQITVYTSIDKTALAPLLTVYAEKNAIPIHIVQDEPMSILARLKAEGANSPADIILTEDTGVFNTAAEAGLLQPFNTEKALANVPQRYRDPDGNWIALSSYARTAVYDSRVLHANDISSYADLAKTKWSQKLCMSQGRYIPNQSLVVNLINNLGDKKTQEVMQGWMANLTMPVVLDDTEVLKAIENGKCQLGLVSSHHYASYLQAHPQTPIQLTFINKGYGGVHTNITGAAIPHAAKHPELALGLIEWLASKDQQTLYASLSKTYPIDKNTEATVLLKSWGDLEASPIAVSEYGEKQKLAIELMKEAAYF